MLQKALSLSCSLYTGLLVITWNCGPWWITGLPLRYSITAESPLASDTAMCTVALALPPGPKGTGTIWIRSAATACTSSFTVAYWLSR